MSSGCSRLAAATQTTAGHGTTIPGTGTPPAPSITPLFTSPADTHSAATSSHIPPFLPYPTATVLSSSAGATAHYTYPATGVVTAYSTLSAAASPPPPSPFPGGPSSTTPPPSPPSHQLNTGTIIAIVLSALAVILASAIALFFCCCRDRAQRSSGRSKRVSVVESSRRRLEPHAYGGRASPPISSVWTGFGSVSVDPHFDPRPKPPDLELWRHSNLSPLGLQFAEKPKPEDGLDHLAGLGRLAAFGGTGRGTPGASPCHSLAPPVRDSFVRHDRGHEGLPRMN
ncbi:hypothetical protein V8D89_010029 [Ganoderma adspersum]